MNLEILRKFEGIGFASVRDFGATGNGVTDDTAAIQACFDAFSSGAGGMGLNSAGAPPTVYLPDGIYMISSTITIPNAIRVIGAGRWNTWFKAASGFTGVMIQDKGNASKIMLENFKVYANDETGVTDLINLGNGGSGEWGTEGYAKGLFLRGGASTVNAGTCGIRHLSNVISILDCHTLYTAEGFVESANSDVTWYDDISILGTTGYGIYVNGTGAIGRVEIEAPSSTSVGIYCNRELNINAMFYSQASGVTNASAIEIGANATAFSMQQFVHAVNGGSVLTAITLDNRSTYPANWPDTQGSGTRRATGVSDKLSVATQHIFVQGQALQSFKLRITNTAGTLQHRFSGTAAVGVLGDYSSKINAAQNALGNTPTGADASTAMATGGKISSASTNDFICDTAPQDSTDKDAMCHASIAFNSTGTALICQAFIFSRDVNGVTRRRLEFAFYDAATGANFALTTANIGAGTFIDVSFLGFIA